MSKADGSHARSLGANIQRGEDLEDITGYTGMQRGLRCMYRR